MLAQHVGSHPNPPRCDDASGFRTQWRRYGHDFTYGTRYVELDALEDKRHLNMDVLASLVLPRTVFQSRPNGDISLTTLAPRPFDVLCALVRKPRQLHTKHTLLDDVWGHQFVSESVLKTAVSDLRSVLDDDPREPRFIETVSRRGYRFIAPTTAISDRFRRNDSAGRVPSVTALAGESGFAFPPPRYATAQEIDYAFELKRRLRARYGAECPQEALCA